MKEEFQLLVNILSKRVADVAALWEGLTVWQEKKGWAYYITKT